MKNNHLQWDQCLLEFRFALNSAWHKSTGFFLAEVAAGKNLKSRMEQILTHAIQPNHPLYWMLEKQSWLKQLVKDNEGQVQEEQSRYKNQCIYTMWLEEGNLEWISSHPQSYSKYTHIVKQEPQWKGPAKILKLKSCLNYQVELIKDLKQEETVHMANLRPYNCHGFREERRPGCRLKRIDYWHCLWKKINKGNTKQ